MISILKKSFRHASTLSVLAGLIAPNGAFAAAPSAAAAKTSPTVRIDNFTFSPAALTVAVGTTVTWVNGDDIPHTVTAIDKSFKSKVLDSGDRFSFTFTRAGEIGYFCSLHPRMMGKMFVRAKN